jgi:hypothetical protein
LFGDDLIIKDNLADYWNRVQSTRPMVSVLLGDGKGTLFGVLGVEGDVAGAGPEE